MVFVTFLVKDALRDHLKDLADSIAQAQSEALIRRDVYEVRLQLQSIAHLMTRDGSGAPTSLSEKQRTFGLRSELPELESTSSDLATACNSMRRLSKAMDESADEENAVCWAATKHQETLDEVVSQTGPLSAPPLTAETLSRLEPEVEHLRNELTSLQAQASIVSAAQVHRADSIRLSDEHRYSGVVKVSYVLYGIGWLFGLAAKVFGVSGVDAEES